jgi:acetamidase/formamidase
MLSNRHTLHAHQSHYGWDNSETPVLRVAPGEIVSFEVKDASGGRMNPAAAPATLEPPDVSRVNPVTGPVWIEGLEPGDALKVTLLEFAPSGWGWTAASPRMGLLGDQFPEREVHHWQYDKSGTEPAAFGTFARVPLRPFAGTIGVAPAAPGRHSVVPPRRVGGNMDLRDVAAGAELYLPVEVAGGLFSIGDTHAAQGDGEVCGTAIESPMLVTARFDIVKDARLAFPRLTLHGPDPRHLDAKGYEITTGIGPDLMQCARDAVSGMIDVLTAAYHMRPVEAYMLCSVCADLRISEIVDRPNWVVSLYMPRMVFD